MNKKDQIWCSRSDKFFISGQNVISSNKGTATETAAVELIIRTTIVILSFTDDNLPYITNFNYKLQTLITLKSYSSCKRYSLSTIQIKGYFVSKLYSQLTFTRSKSTIKTPERRQWRRFGVFIVNFEHISHLF